MKVCHKEAMKLINELEDKKDRLIGNESRLNTVQYRDGEPRPDTGYSYEKTRAEIAAIDDKVRKIKHKLAKANCSVKVEEFNMTLGEALVYLAQLSSELSRLNDLAYERQEYTSIAQGGITLHIERLYNVKTAEADAAALTGKIGKLQVAIDRANLVNYIEV